ncbi:MAG: zinc ribbon domain-containing protein [Candidatus Bipolaricaulia bacterium]
MATRDGMRALIELAEQDQRIQKLQTRLAGLRDQKGQVEAKIESERADLEAKRADLSELERRSREAGAEVDDLDSQIRKHEHQLEEGLLSFKEMETVRDRIQHNRERMEALEEEALELMDQVEARQAEMAEEEARYNDWKARMDEELATLQADIDEQSRKIEEAQTKRAELADAVEERLHERYERLRGELADPIVPVRNGRCTGCQLGLSETTLERVREGGDLVTCENCMRILYAS